MVGGVSRGYCEIGNVKMDITPAIASTIAITIAKRGRSTKILENGFNASTAALIPSFISVSPQKLLIVSPTTVMSSIIDRRLEIRI